MSQTASTEELLAELSTPASGAPRVGIVLAAGHGKRIRSETSKMLHEIWGKPTALRVADAVEAGLDSPSQMLVVGIKATEVAQTIGAKPGRVFAYQKNPVLGLPAGTGDAVRVGLDAFPDEGGDRDIYIFLGDMGLLTGEAVSQFRHAFESEESDMTVLTGRYSGPAEQNYYGRIVRVPTTDCDGAPAGEDEGKVIEIKEHKDILGLPEDGHYDVAYNGLTYRFGRNQLLEMNEINTGVFAFKESHLRTLIREIKTDNAQGELMLTDLVHIFNQHGRVVRAVLAASEEEILAFNVKSVWRQMETIAHRWAYERLMDLITIVDEEDFFIADETIDHIIALDRDRGPLDIVIGKGAYIGPRVRLNGKVHLGDGCRLDGDIVLGEGVCIGHNTHLSTYPNQKMVLEDGVEILSGDILKGNLRVGTGSRIESGVCMTGSDQYPMRVGAGVTIKGTTYLFGCVVDDGLLIHHSVVLHRHLEQVRRRDGSIQPIRFVLPPPEGLDSITPLTDRSNNESDTQPL
jgi:bifunctional UDP-N-acetylglucosamine pyrophosphorylase / glucosamine-1-phosphate N-acetyltransferase